jgi:hypothetical protein
MFAMTTATLATMWRGFRDTWRWSRNEHRHTPARSRQVDTVAAGRDSNHRHDRRAIASNHAVGCHACRCIPPCTSMCTATAARVPAPLSPPYRHSLSMYRQIPPRHRHADGPVRRTTGQLVPVRVKASGVGFDDAAQCTGIDAHSATVQCVANMAQVQMLVTPRPRRRCGSWARHPSTRDRRPPPRARSRSSSAPIPPSRGTSR